MSCQGKVSLTLNSTECTQAAIARRDAELQRLGAALGGGRDGDLSLLQHRADSAEAVVVQLSQKARA